MRLWPSHAYLLQHDIAILQAPVDALVAAAERQTAVTRDALRAVPWSASDSREILRLHDDMGHRLSPKRLDQRFGNGLRFFTFEAGADLVGSTWAAVGDGRYVDELNWFLPIRPTEFWVRDVFVVPRRRGGGLLSAFLHAVAQQVPQCSAAWSDVDWIHKASLRAHLKAGFSLHARVRALDLNGRWRLRSPLPPWHLPVSEIDPHRRWVSLTGPVLRRHQGLIA
jgi:GNAT superfamily N-acetyltransferase